MIKDNLLKGFFVILPNHPQFLFSPAPEACWCFAIIPTRDSFFFFPSPSAIHVPYCALIHFLSLLVSFPSPFFSFFYPAPSQSTEAGTVSLQLGKAAALLPEESSLCSAMRKALSNTRE